MSFLIRTWFVMLIELVLEGFQNLTFQSCDLFAGDYCPLGTCPTNPAHPLIPGNCSGILVLNNQKYMN